MIDWAVDQIIAVMADDDERTPAEALLAATRHAALLWWEHGKAKTRVS